MSSVTKRIREIKQPWGGYIKPSQFELTTIDDGHTLFETENIHASVVGMAVDYLTRFLMGTPITVAFSISLKGAMIAAIFLRNPDIMKIALDMLSNIRGLDKKSIVNTCKMTTFDV